MTTSSASLNRRVYGVALLSLLWLAVLAWARPLMLPDEGRYVGVAWEMMRSGDWLVPTLNGLPYFHKPPLFYWITAASMSIFGTGELAARAAPLLGAWAGAMAVYLLLRRWRGERPAVLALMVLLAQPLFYMGGQFANLDMLVAGCITVTIVLLAHAALQTELGAPARAAILGAYVAAALGVLAKGMIGAVLPALVIIAWLASGRRWRTLVALLSPAGVAVFFAVAAPWFLAMQTHFDGFLDYFFILQQVKRFAAGGFNNVQPFYFYPAVLLLFTLPWLPWLRPLFGQDRVTDAVRGDLRRLMLFWIAAIGLFFSLPASKLLGYILPVVPPIAVLLADGIESWAAQHPRTARRWPISAALCMVLSLGVIIGLAVRKPNSTQDLAAALRAQGGVTEPVYMLGTYYFDFPLYARLAEPVRVVLDWRDPAVRSRDNWRKELADAGEFSPERARALLLEPAQLTEAVCQRPVSWFLGSKDTTTAYPFLAAAQLVASTREANLWRLDRRAQPGATLDCPLATRPG